VDFGRSWSLVIVRLRAQGEQAAAVEPIVNELRANMVRVDADFSATPFKAMISNEELESCSPPPHVGGYRWSSAVATWNPAR